MNWTASLLRNQLKKERLAYESKLSLLLSTSETAKEIIRWKEKYQKLVQEIESRRYDEIIDKLIEASQLKDQDLETKEAQITNLAEKFTASKELIFNLRKEIRTNSLYYQQELRKIREDYQIKFQEQTKHFKNELAQPKQELTDLLGEGSDSLRELKARAKLLAKLEQQTKEQKQALDLANSKSKQLQAVFQQVIDYMNRQIIIRKAPLKEYFQQIQELMQWEGMVSLANTSSATPNPQEE